MGIEHSTPQRPQTEREKMQTLVSQGLSPSAIAIIMNRGLAGYSHVRPADIASWMRDENMRQRDPRHAARAANRSAEIDARRKAFNDAKSERKAANE